MTKDWDLVKERIRELSVDQKKCLEDVKATMESKHKFRASTRAYRMKLKEWGYLRHKPRKGTAARKRSEGDGNIEDLNADSADDSDESAAAIEGSTILLQEARDLLPTIDPWAQARTLTTEVVMDMLAAILDADSQKLEQLLQANPTHANYPIGLPFDAHSGRFFNHPAIQQCILLEHPDQTLFDIACALPSGPVVWVLVAYGAKGSTHPLGSDLAFHNAIRNGRTYTVQCLLHSGQSKANGELGVPWKPLLQAVFWNMPDIVRMLIDRGAKICDIASPVDGAPFKNALQIALGRRRTDYLDKPIRERCDRIIKMLLDAGANIHIPATEDSEGLTPFETFIKPWQGNQLWMSSLSPTEIGCLETFMRKGANLQSSFNGFPCLAASRSTFEHQVLWHTTPAFARQFIDYATPTSDANGATLLHEIVGFCPDAKRHPTDTLRDIESLLAKGADPNLFDKDGSTPLSACIARCPGVDIFPFLNALLEAGADPELRDGHGVRPVVLAARAFQEPLLSRVMDLLVAKVHGKQPNLDESVWSEGYFPISQNPTFRLLLCYTGQDGEFETNMQRMLPGGVIPAFRKACFSVISKNYLDTVTEQRNMTGDFRLTISEKDEIQHVIRLRQAQNLPEYKFDQDFVMGLLAPTFRPAELPIHDGIAAEKPVELSAAETSALQTLAPFLINPNLPSPLPPDTPQAVRRASISSSSSNGSASSFFIPSTTQIRWPEIGDPTKPDDWRKAKKSVLRYKCKDCVDGPKLTKAEYDKHRGEHWHTMTCHEVGCKRRFCIAERG